MVPRVGLEPTRLAPPDFESGVFTGFTTSAQIRIIPARPAGSIQNRAPEGPTPVMSRLVFEWTWGVLFPLDIAQLRFTVSNGDARDSSVRDRD